VSSVAVGDHVVLSFIPSCGKCPSCQAGLRNLCDLGAGLLAGTAVSDGTHRIHAADGQPVFPMTLLGTFSPYMVVHESSVVKIDPDIPFEVACLVGCGVTTGYGSATHTARSARVRTSRSSASAVSAWRAAGRRQRRCPQRLRRRPGGVQTRPGAQVRRHPRLPGHLQRDGRRGRGHSGGDGTRPSSPSASSGRGHRQLHEHHRQGRHVVATAVANMASNDVKLNLSMLTLLQKRTAGTIFGGGNPHHDIPQLLSMYKAGRLNLDDMVTRQYQLEQINDGYADMLEGRNIRGVIRYTDADR
jgi:S-(hydroxymethyl)glutathione dehydrogenase/alcohol dehydrogenase